MGAGIEVKLQAFEGPLELLLHLIEKNKVSIYDIPIVMITEQYMEYLNQMDRRDLDSMSEFLVMAATLLNIKAKMLLPKKQEENQEEEEDPRLELVRRLIEYKMYHYAAMELKDRQLDANKSMYKKKDLPKEVLEYKEEIDPKTLVDGITLQKLNEIFQSVMKKQVDKIDPIRSKFGEIKKEEVSLEEKMQEISEKIRGLRNIRFRTLLEIQASKVQVVVTFLAILELMKTGIVTIRQESLFAEIIVDGCDG